jgi:hypothetical protein
MLSLMVFGITYVLVQLGTAIYKNAIYVAQFGASALAPDFMLRYAMSSFFPLFSVKMIDHMSFEWAMSMFAFLSLAVAVVPFVLYRYGETMLQSSRYLDKMPRRE